MNIHLYFILLTLIFHTANAQVQVSTIDDKNNHSFPFIRSKNTTVAKNINSYLQGELLQNEKVETSADSIFENAKYVSGDSLGQSGYESISYKVERNNAQVLSLSFDFESTGAYTSYYHGYYSFSLQTGKLITAQDLLTAAGINYLRKLLPRIRQKRINQFVKEEAPNAEASALMLERYALCNEDASVDNIFIRGQGVTFYKEYCFPQGERPYDTSLDVTFTIKQLEKYLNDSGKKLLLKK